MSKKLLSIVVSLSLMFSVFSYDVLAEEKQENNLSLEFYNPSTDGILSLKEQSDKFGKNIGTETHPFLIQTGEQLKELSDIMILEEYPVTTQFTTACYLQISDIDISDYCKEGGGWQPIDNFKGNYDGGNFKVSGLKIDRLDFNQGLFGRCRDVILKNIVIDNCDIRSYNTTGTVAGDVIGRIENCISSGVVVGGIEPPNHERVGYDTGGIVGSIIGEIINCENNCIISGNDTVGGIVGRAKGTVERCINKGSVNAKSTVGGIGGTITGNVKDSYNEARVEGRKAGGITGIFFQNIYKGGSISGCFNTGDIYGTQYSAGICAVIGNTGDITKCASVGSIYSDYIAAGITVFSTPDITDCYVSGKIQSNNLAVGIMESGYTDREFKRCYNIAEISGSNTYGIASLIYPNENVSDIISLNPSITSTKELALKIGLLNNEFDLKGCYSWNKTKIFSNNKNPDIGNKIPYNGISKTAADFMKAETWAAFANNDAWIYQEGKLPILKGIPLEYQNSNMPSYILAELDNSSSSGGSSSSSSDSYEGSKTIEKKEEVKKEVTQEQPKQEVNQLPKVEYNDTANHWAKGSIEFVSNMGLLSGTEKGKFNPEAKASRGMFITVLGRLVKAEEKPNNDFLDVPKNSYYAGFIGWASEKGIVSGVEKNLFAPDSPLTREQMAVLIYNFEKSQGKDVSDIEGMAIKEFNDYINVSSWANDAVRYCFNSGILNGKGNSSLDPKGYLTRAEMAVVIEKLYNMI